MALNKRLISAGSPVCTTEAVDIFGDSSGVALYSLDYDASDAGSYNGTASNVTFGVQGKTNTGARFDGDNSRITLPAISAIPTNSSPNKSYSVSFWINSTTTRLNAPSGTYRSGQIFGFFDDTYSMIGFGGDSSSSFPTGKFYYYNYGGSGQRNNWIITPNSYADGNYHHVVVTDEYVSSGNTRNRKLYVDGSLIVSDNQANTWLASSGGNTIGSANANNQLNADLDQVRIFSKALDQTEINTLYNSGSGEIACVYTATTTNSDYPTTNLAYYKLDNSAEDSKGTADGTESNIEYRFGLFGQALKYSGASSNVETTLANSNFTSNYSISFWVNLDNANTFQNFVGNYKSSGGYGGFTFMSRDVGSGVYRYGFIWWYTTGDLYNYVDNNDVLATSGNWAHLVVTKASSALPKLYVNGTASSLNYRNAVTDHATTTENFKIGNTLNTNYSAGLIDQVRIFSSELSSSQVTQLYNEKPETDTSNFKTVLYEGNGGTNFVSNVGFEPGLVWIKSRDDAHDHVLYDVVRGAGSGKALSSNATSAQGAYDATYGFLDTFEATGFVVKTGSSYANYTNKNNESYVAWNWKAGGTPVTIGVNSITGSTPSIASTVSANPAAGFSIIRNTGTANYSDTIGHGLTQAPEIVIQKPVVSNVAWYVLFNVDGTGGWDYASLNTTAAFAADSPVRFSANSTTINNWGWTNYDMINYCFHSVSGYSSIATYQGVTGNKVITTGFRPSFVMIKNTSNAGNNWNIMDSRRDTSNPIELNLWADTSDTESTASQSNVYDVDFDNNGFTIKNNYGPFNGNGQSYLYMAFK